MRQGEHVRCGIALISLSKCQIDKTVHETNSFYRNRTNLTNEEHGKFPHALVSGWILPPNVSSLKRKCNEIRGKLRRRGLERLMTLDEEVHLAKMIRSFDISIVFIHNTYTCESGTRSCGR